MNLRTIPFIIFINILFSQISEGNILFSPYTSGGEAKTYLMDVDGNFIHTWNHERGPASMPYLLSDSTLIYPFRVEFPTMDAGGVGGGIQGIDWDGEVLWELIISNEQYQHHHDVEPLPNGNILIIAWENKSSEEAFSLGRESIGSTLNQIWSTAILEYEPYSGEIVWEWHLWDHLIQDINSELPNYGVISQHPELFDINCGSVGNNAGGPQGANADWMHINAIDYNEFLDQIVISSRTQNEIYIIDHSTTIEEAASHSGGNSGMGGDFLYRWGNPANYHSGDASNQILNAQHGVNWVSEGFPGSGNLILFNNFHSGNQSAVLEIVPPLNEQGIYEIEFNNGYGPFDLEMEYLNDFTTPMQGGAFRLGNGNTLITQTHTSRIIEVSSLGEVVWDYTYDSSISGYWIARAEKYPLDYLDNILLGDVNNDGIINILDVVSSVNIVLGNLEWVGAADYNNDGIINILDIVSIVNLILNSI